MYPPTTSIGGSANNSICNGLYKTTAPYYGSEGQQSIDPVVFFKLLLIGYLENLNSDRRIIAHAQMRLDLLYFLGYNLDEPPPWHSTISRTRQLYGEAVAIPLPKAANKAPISTTSGKQSNTRICRMASR